MSVPSPDDAFIALRGVSKRFASVVANRLVDLSVRRGEIVALAGENGAGKSTIVNMLSGLIEPDEGTILLEGIPARLNSPLASVEAGIGTVHQHYMLVPTLSGLDNIALQLGELGRGRLDRAGLARRVAEVSGALGFDIELDRRIDSLDVAQQQRIEIVKAMMHRVKLLILDEPTAVLGADDKRHLFDTIRRLREHGTSVILITHKLEDIFAVADRAVIMKAGSVVAQADVEALTPAAIVGHMVGASDVQEAEAIVKGFGRAPRTTEVAEALCSARDLTLRRPNGSLAVSGLTLDLHAGEIVALAGVDGNGQSEFMRCLAGMERPSAGVVECLGESTEAGSWSPALLRRRGVSHIPEDRRRFGIVAQMTLMQNYLLGNQERPGLFRWGLLRAGRLSDLVAQRLSEFEVRAPGPTAPMRTLSGGNQQKMVLARELDYAPKVLLAAHPSRGLDIKTIRFVHRSLDRARAEGMAVLVQSSDIDEIMAIADRLIVFSGGRVFGPAPCESVSRNQLGAWIAGQEEMPW
ncbi:ABC transporter ATP-binding protein [Nitratireductor mangrovi]|uniref:ABC transporter ATP-binding protein n=1 Tax=Nitratireductor mangrovi TaxID=2599600 RepID=A0A5B8L0U6_9HYPH|nr:ABC transporter ATP-binding protein [Nitratireductor mangrovi]QDZ01300.1 ABC transporter ATP-binding protein [Nitratireductor mangrovi]